MLLPHVVRLSGLLKLATRDKVLDLADRADGILVRVGQARKERKRKDIISGGKKGCREREVKGSKLDERFLCVRKYFVQK
jgi:hypothetical protein